MNITASDKSVLLRLAASLPKGDETRRAILAGLKRVSSAGDAKYPTEICANCGEFLRPYDAYLHCKAFPNDHRKQHEPRKMTPDEVVKSRKSAAAGDQPDPKKKYDLYVAYGQGFDDLLKKGLKPSEAAKAMKVVDSVFAAAEKLEGGGYDEDPKLKKLQDRLDKGAFGVKMNLGGELFLVLKDPDDENLAWHWTGNEWELE